MKYIKQPDFSSCGPVAIINAKKWLGYDAGLKDLKRLRSLCNTDNDGTQEDHMRKAMKTELKHHLKKKINSSIKTMDQYLKQNKSFILGYWYSIGDKEHGHYVFCAGKTKGGRYILINEADHRSIREDRRPTKVYRRRDEIIKMLRGDSDLWLIGS